MHIEDIARQLGISGAAASKGYTRALNRIPEPDAKKARMAQLMRLDLMRFKLYARLADPKVRNKEDIVRTLLKVEERESKLRGLDAPTKMEQLNIEDPLAAARRERQMEILGRFTLEERQELLQLIQQPKEGKGAPDRGDSAELEK